MDQPTQSVTSWLESLGINDGGNDLQAPATARAAFDVNGEYALSKHAQLMRRGA